MSSDDLVASVRVPLMRVYASGAPEDMRLPLTTPKGKTGGELQLLVGGREGRAAGSLAGGRAGIQCACRSHGYAAPLLVFTRALSAALCAAAAGLSRPSCRWCHRRLPTQITFKPLPAQKVPVPGGAPAPVPAGMPAAPPPVVVAAAAPVYPQAPAAQPAPAPVMVAAAAPVAAAPAAYAPPQPAAYAPPPQQPAAYAPPPPQPAAYAPPQQQAYAPPPQQQYAPPPQPQYAAPLPQAPPAYMPPPAPVPPPAAYGAPPAFPAYPAAPAPPAPYGGPPPAFPPGPGVQDRSFPERGLLQRHVMHSAAGKLRLLGVSPAFSAAMSYSQHSPRPHHLPWRRLPRGARLPQPAAGRPAAAASVPWQRLRARQLLSSWLAG